MILYLLCKLYGWLWGIPWESAGGPTAAAGAVLDIAAVVGGWLAWSDRRERLRREGKG